MSDEPTNSRKLAAVSAAMIHVVTKLSRLRPAVVTLGRWSMIVLRGAGWWARLLIILVVFLLPTIALVLAIAGGDWDPSARDAARSLWLSLSLLVVGVMWLALWRAFRAVRSLVRAPFLGPSVGPRILAAALVCGIYRKILAGTIWGLAWGVGQLALSMPLKVARAAQDLVPASREAIAPDMAKKLADTAIVVPKNVDGAFGSWLVGTFLRTVDKQLADVAKGLQSKLEVHDIIIGSIVWVTVAFVLATLAGSTAPRRVQVVAAMAGQGIATGVRASWTFVARQRLLNGQNLGFVIILLGGLFFSLAAITSLPRLREGSKPNSAVSVEELRRELSGLQNAREELANYYPDDIGDDLFKPVSPTPGPPAQPADQPKRDALPPPATTAVVTPAMSAAAATPVAPRGAVALRAATAARKTGTDAARDKAPVVAADVGRNAPTEGPGTGGDAREERAGSDSPLSRAKQALAAAEAEEDQASNDVRRAFDDVDKFKQAWKRVDASSKKARAAREAVEVARKDATLPALVDESRKNLSSLWANVVASYRLLREFVISDEASSAQAAVRAYGLQNIERQGSREEVLHFLAIRNWYDEKVSYHRSRLQLCSEETHHLRWEIANWTSSVGASLSRSEDLLAALEKVSALHSSYAAILELQLRCVRTCVAPETERVPQPPPLGDSLGPLRFVAAWLLNAASLPLALIVGLIGFGLLGSAISTFVKERIQATVAGDSFPRRHHVLVYDLTGILLRGLSAAIVVFLAVQGGLAVLSGSGSDPNPYVLLLACFVAAVFSERVWQKAYESLRARLTGEGEEGEGEGTAEGEGEAKESTSPAEAGTSPPASDRREPQGEVEAEPPASAPPDPAKPPPAVDPAGEPPIPGSK